MNRLQKKGGALILVLLISGCVGWQPVAFDAGNSVETLAKQLLNLNDFNEKKSPVCIHEETTGEEAGSMELTGGLSLYFL